MTIQNKTLSKKNILRNKISKIITANILGWLVFLIGSIVDGIIAGSFLSEDALLAVEVVTPFYTFAAFLAAFLCAGAAIMYSNEMGAGNNDKAHKIFGTGLVITVCLGAVSALCMYLFKTQLLEIFRLNPDAYAYASDYYDWYIGVVALYPVIGYVYSFVSEDGESLWVLASDLSSTIVKIVLSLMLVSSMGISGLGLAMVVSIAVTFLVVCFHFFRKNNSVKFGFGCSWKDILGMITWGVGVWGGYLFAALLDLFMNGFISAKFGDQYLASYAIVNFSLCFAQLFTSISSGIACFLSSAYGGKNCPDLKYIVTLGEKWNAAVCLVSTVLMVALSGVIPTLYGIESLQQIEAGRIAVFAIALSYLSYGFIYLVCGYYASQEKPQYTLVCQMMITFLLPMLLCPILSAVFGYYGLIAGFAVTPIIVAAGLFFWLKKKNGTIFEFPDFGEAQTAYDLELSHSNIMLVRDEIEKFLISENVEKASVLKTIGVVEDLLFIVYGENKDKKILDRITICVGQSQIRIMNNDDGKPFNIKDKTDPEDFSKGYYLLGKLPVRESLNSYLLVSFNHVNLILNR